MNFYSPEVLAIRETTHTQNLAEKYNAVPEYVLPDGCRVDLMVRHAQYGFMVDSIGKPYKEKPKTISQEFIECIEVEWAYKFYEAVGQSLYYACMTGVRPGIILLDKKGEDNRLNIVKCNMVCQKHGINMYVEKVDE